MKPRPWIRDLDERLGGILADWVRGVLPRARWVVLASVASTLALLAVAVPRLGINSNEEALFSRDVEFAELREEFRAAFPALVDPVVVVVDGATMDVAQDAAERLRDRLLENPGSFEQLYLPGGGPFFERHGLLYLEVDELQDTVDRLVEVQPYLGELSRDPSLRGFFSMLAEAADASAEGLLERVELPEVFDQVSEVVRSGGASPLSWSELLLGRPATPLDKRRVLLVQPIVDHEALEPAAVTLNALRQALDDLGFDADPSVEVRLTGLYPLSAEEAEHVNAQTTWAGLASFVLVSIVLLTGLRSVRLVLSILATLLVGLGWTAAFAGLAVGHLNLISVAFTVLFIGLSVDFGIHIGVRYRELVGSGLTKVEALCETARDVGGSLVICSVTTSVGFYAFIPTDFRGVAELGLIAGTGMFVSLFFNLTLLPALLFLAPPPAQGAPPKAPSRLFDAFVSLPIRHARAIVLTTSVLVVGSLLLLPDVHFDFSPLRVRDPATQSVQAFQDLLEDGLAFPWNLNVLAEDQEAADRVAERLRELPTVDDTLSLSDYVPANQEQKLAILQEAAFLLLPSLSTEDPLPAPGSADRLAALVSLAQSLARVEAAHVSPELDASASRLRKEIASFRRRLGSGDAAAVRLATLDAALTGSLPSQLRILRSSLTPGLVSVAELPRDLKEQTVAADGRVRVEVFPKEDLNDNDALSRYVDSVREVAPRAFGEGLVIHEIGGIAVRSFRQALITAALAIAAILILLWWNFTDFFLVALSISLAGLFTAAGTVLLDRPFNFANVIVIPLLTGMGVDTGIHLVHRYRFSPLPDGNLLRTSTSRAVILSALTTAASFGTLGFSTHAGMASLGQLLTLGILLILLCNLVVLPVAVRALRSRRAEPPTAET